MGTEANVEDLVKLVRAALDPGAAGATKGQATEFLRTLIRMIEGASGAGEPVAASPAQLPADPLTAILERLWPLLAAEVESVAAQLGIPFIPLRR